MENIVTTRQLHRKYSCNHIYLDFLNKMIAENMIKKLPTSDFVWYDNMNFNFIQNYDYEKSDKSYMIECNLTYSEYLLSDYPLCAEHLIIDGFKKQKTGNQFQ